MAKQQLNLRVSALTRRQLDKLTARWGMNQTEVITMIIDREYEREENVANSAQIKVIKVEYSEDAVWGVNDPADYDAEASYARYEQFVAARLEEMYPGATILFERGLNDSITIDGNHTHDEEQWVEDAVGKIWSDFKWVVEK